MEFDKKKFYSLVPNYAALRELEEKYYRKPTEKEIREFIDFWRDIYDIWSRNNPPDDLTYIEEKIKVRKALIATFGLRQ